MMYREFGDKSDPVYQPWWEILGLPRPIDNVEEIELLYRKKSELYTNYTYGEEMLALLCLALGEALNREIKPGVVVTWTDCPGYLEWMQPFKVIGVNAVTKQAELDGIRHSVPISQLLAT